MSESPCSSSNSSNTLQSSKPQFNRVRAKPLPIRKVYLSEDEKVKFRSMSEDLIGTRGGYILDSALNILGKVPISELGDTIKSLNTGMYAIVFDGKVDENLLNAAEVAKISHLVGMDVSVRRQGSVNVMKAAEL